MRKSLLKINAILTIIAFMLFSFASPLKSIAFAEGQNGTTLTAYVDASGVWNRVYNWDIDKTVTPSLWNLFQGDTGTSKYTITLTKDSGTDEKYLEGKVYVTNAGVLPTENLNIVVKLTLPPSSTILAQVSANVSEHPVLAPGETYGYSYKIIYNGTSDKAYKITADITITNHSGQLDVPFGPSPSTSASIPSSPNNIINDTINVDDTNGSSWVFNTSGSVEYEKTFTSDDKGVYNNTATIRETGKYSSAAVTVNSYALQVSKTANTSFTRKYTWTIDKTGDQTSLTLTKGQVFPVNYTVVLDASYEDMDYSANGTISIHNPAPMDALINSVSDVISPDIAAVVTGAEFPMVLGAGETKELSYTAALPDGTARVNTAEAVLQNHSYDYNLIPTPTGTTRFEGNANVNFTDASINEIDESINVSDDKFGNLGTVNYSEVPKTFNYTLNIGPYDAIGSYQYINTASFIANDTQTSSSDSWIVNINVPGSGATLTIGYWKNHAGFGPQKDMVSKLLPIWIGNPLGSKSIFIDSPQKAVDMLTMTAYGGGLNGIAKLYAQLLAAKLNIANGADPSAVSSTITAADKFLASYNNSDWAALTKSQQKSVLSWMTTLDSYNNGLIGPGHASE